MMQNIPPLTAVARTILGEFHPNSLGPTEEAPDLRPYLAGLSTVDRNTAAAQFDIIAGLDRPIRDWLEERIGDDLRDEPAARTFLVSLARFVYGTSSEQPDIADALE